ncbi:hypothetical protein HMPREF9061_01187 [Actinomyces sp. oral taxon 181 str. F0379]|nr:hypothetical protein HMPREF9061_01187 [Actinomyces sp. oral taxon 181 str. F0379]
MSFYIVFLKIGRSSLTLPLQTWFCGFPQMTIALLQLKVVAHRRQLPCTLRIHEAFIYLLLARLSFVALWKPVKSFGQLQRTGLAPIR